MSLLDRSLRWLLKSAGLPEDGATGMDTALREGKQRPAFDVAEPRPDGSTYWVFTTQFDQEVAAEELEASLPGLSVHQQAAMTSSLAELWRSVEADAETARQAASETAHRIGERLGAQTNDMAVTLLIDHSGSVRRESLAETLMLTRRLLTALGTLAVPLDVLGYTTTSWKGGNARQLWVEHGQPRWPGRLCGLRHIVYDPVRQDPGELTHAIARLMRRPDVSRENVDGEALIWAASRLRQREKRNKILILVGDGAPADDSTIAANGESFLDQHFRNVWDELCRSVDIDLIGLSIAPANRDRSDHPPEGMFAASEALQRLEELMVNPKGRADS